MPSIPSGYQSSPYLTPVVLAPGVQAISHETVPIASKEASKQRRVQVDRRERIEAVRIAARASTHEHETDASPPYQPFAD